MRLYSRAEHWHLLSFFVIESLDYIIEVQLKKFRPCQCVSVVITALVPATLVLA